MDNLREDFILDNQPGDFITILLQNGKEWTGTILDWNERRVRLQVDGVARTVSFNIIDAYYPAESDTDEEKKEIPQPVLTPAEKAAAKVDAAEYRIAFDPDLVRERLRLAPNTIEKEKITALFQNYLRAETAPDAPMAVKRVMTAAGTLSAQYPESTLTQSVIGEMAMKNGDWNLAEESFYAAACYSRAFFSAMQLQNEEKMAEDGACHLLYEKKKEEELIFLFIRMAAKAGDLSVFRRFLLTENDRYPQLCAECLCWLLKNAGLALPEGENIAEPTVIDAMGELFDRYYPDPVNNQMKSLEDEGSEEEAAETPAEEQPQPAPEPTVTEEKKALPVNLKGYIGHYNALRHFGYILSPECPDWFFHYNHIVDPLLQGMLETEPGRRYLVTFDVGTNHKGQCACNIRLTDPANPYDAEPEIRRTGTITSFFPHYMNGRITSGEDVYHFRVNQITDTTLRDYCSVFPDAAMRKFKVSFTLRQAHAGNKFAVDVQLEEPFSDAELKVIREQVEVERNRRGVISRYHSAQQKGMIIDGATDYQFELSDVTDPDLRSALENLPDPAGRQFRVKFASTYRGGNPCAEDVRLIDPLGEQDRRAIEQRTAPKPVDNPFLLLPPWPAGVSRDGLYLAAQQERLKGDPQKAVSRYLDAIRAQDRLESSISDLVSLYLQLRQDENAILLMKAFEWALPEEKAINNWISVYDRTKSDDPLLLSFYERILGTSLKVNTKLHYLVKKAQLLTRMDRYDDAMATYDQWEALAAQAERGFMGSSGWEQVAISDGLRSLIARGRAICLYHQGHREEAQAIAARLVAQNPADTAAKQILEGKLDTASDSVLADQQQDISVSAYENLTPFVKEMVDQFSLQRVTRIRSIDNDKFTGNVQQAIRDLEGYEQIAPGTAPQARSDRKLAAAKLILRCLQRTGGVPFQEKGLDKFSEGYFETLLGSGLCSYGDAQLRESRPLQSVRYIYLQALPLLLHSSTRTPNRDRVDAVVHYITTYFLTGDRLVESTYHPGEIDRCVKLFAEHPCINIAGFVTGLFFLLENNTPYDKSILSALYTSPLKDEVIDLLKQAAALPGSAVDNEADFITLWNQASDQWLRSYRTFCGNFSSSRMDLLSSARIDTLKNAIAHDQLFLLPDESDRQTLEEFMQVLALFDRLSTLSEFELREQTLRSIGDRCSSLFARITRNPTTFTYDTLLGTVRAASQAASRQLEEIYNESRPSLTVTAGDSVSPASDGRLLLTLSIENGANLQTADNLRVLVVPDDGIRFQQIDGLKGHVKGGSQEGLIVSFSADPGDTRTAFSAAVTVTYEYRENGATRTAEQKQVFPVSISTASAKPIKNPFRAHASQQEVEDPNMFFGRDKDIEDIIRIISDDSGQLTPKKSVALYGQKRTGKSSLLYHVRERIRKNFPQAVVLDLGSLGTYDTANNDFTKGVMGGILSKLRRAVLLDKRYADLKALLKEKELEIPYQKMMDSQNNYDIIFKNFMDDLDWVIKESGVPYRFIIFVDEFTHLYGHIQRDLVTDQFLRFWRESVHDHSWISIIVGQDSMETLKNEYGNELGATAMFPVTYLKPEEAVRMIRVPIGRENPEVHFSEEAVKRLVELTAGSAYLLMILCAELVDYLNEIHHSDVIAAHIDRLVDRVFENGVITGSNFDPLYNDVSCPGDESRKEDNFTLLTELARRTRLAPAVSIEQITPEGLSPERVAELLKALESRGVVRVEQNQYSIIVGLFREWLNNRYGEAL
ncbi:MAG: ATP-binding protein [Oscillospiraceae bacterium]|nr:ATP-binding protein [Oscillospiraceae bacterium]